MTRPEDVAGPGGDHPDVLELIAWSRQETDPGAAEPVEAHVRSCPTCRSQVAALQVLLQIPTVRRRRRTAAAVAATLLAGLAGATFLSRLEPPSPGSTGDPAQAAETRVAPTPPEARGPLAAASRGVEAASGISAARLADLRSLATLIPPPVDEYERRARRAAPAAGPAASRLDGLEAVVEERYDDAADILAAALELAPDDSETAGLLGIARYLSGDDSEATVELLRRGARGRNNVWPGWYLGNALLRRGEIEAATDVLTRVADRGIGPARAAQALLSELSR